MNYCNIHDPKWPKKSDKITLIVLSRTIVKSILKPHMVFTNEGAKLWPYCESILDAKANLPSVYDI